ncbi:MAG TPA: endonuclease/exonuclease/phosphatase family protein [Saprospiraceae bacterium]|nr:endonuclease/exonuclease/phosphatase family protein [Saprospiraceae bacterium]
MKLGYIHLLFCFITFGEISAQEVKVMTYNIRLDHKGDGADNWEFRKEDLVKYIISEKPDFLGVQEALSNQHLYLQEKLAAYKPIGVGREDGKTKGEYSSIFYDQSKWKCIQDSTFWLSETPSVISKGWDASYHRVCTFGLFVDQKGDTIVVSNTHLDHMGVEARKNSVILLKEHVARYSTKYPCILMGDFNFAPEDTLYKSITQGLTDLRNNVKAPQEQYVGTFNGFKTDTSFTQRIDYIYYDRFHWFPYQYKSEEIKTEKGRQVSDHFPVIGILKSINAYEPRQFVSGADTLNYRILYPPNFDKNKKYPLLLLLHGAGERGNDNVKQLIHGGRLFLDSIEKYPAIVIAPQCPSDDYWASVNRTENNGRLNFEFLDRPQPTKSLALVMSLVNEELSKNYIDASRFYVTGLSMGGMGTWELLWRMPQKIAAALPICGGGFAKKAPLMRGIPIWTFHGTKDTTVPIYHSMSMLESVQKSGGTVRINIYDGVGHNSWDNAFAEPNFLKWTFSKKKLNN